MYLTCPNCRAVFEASESLFTAGERQVRCGVCKQQWQAGLSAEQTINELMGEEAIDAFHGLNSFLGKEKKEVNNAPVENKPVVRKPDVKKPYVYLPNAKPPRKSFLKKLDLYIIIVLIGGVVGAFFFRHEILQMYPDTKPAYELLRSFYHQAKVTLQELLNR